MTKRTALRARSSFLPPPHEQILRAQGNPSRARFAGGNHQEGSPPAGPSRPSLGPPEPGHLLHSPALDRTPSALTVLQPRGGRSLGSHYEEKQLDVYGPS